MQPVESIQSPEQFIQSKQQQFVDIASKENIVHWLAESQFALECWYKNKGLQKCSPVSIQNAIINVAACGLSMNPALGLAYLVPEYDKNLGGAICQLRISFKGLMKVAVDSGAIKWVRAEIVRHNDAFDYRGPCEAPYHSMNPFADRGDVVGVYCIAKTADGDVLANVMSKEEIDLIKSKAKFSTVWDTWFDEMAKKAIIKRSAKQWPVSSKANRFMETVSLINEVEGSKEIAAVPAPAKPNDITDDEFSKRFDKLSKAIIGGKSASDVILFSESKGRKLTEVQKEKLLQVK